MAISYNEPITFGRNGTAQGLNCTGIDFSEDGSQSWTSAPVAEIDVQLPFARQDIMLEINATPYLIDGRVAMQDVFVFTGGLFTGFAKLAGHTLLSFPLNRSTLSGRSTRLALVIPTAVSPRSLGLSQDQRELGIYLNAITFRTV
jgi:hypothetical protein